MKLSILIPVYNEASTIEDVLHQVLAVELAGIEKELIVVDDGSTDQTAEILKREQQHHAEVLTVYTNPGNFGKGRALRTALKYATGAILLIQDADLEVDPKGYTDQRLYGAALTDEATAYKVFKADLLKGLDLHCVGFEFCPEVTAKLLRQGHTIREVPISYRPRTKAEGKKLRYVRDGLIAIYTLLKYRFSE